MQVLRDQREAPVSRNRVRHRAQRLACALAIPDLTAFGIRAPGPARDRLTAAFQQLYEGESTGIIARTAAEGFEAVQLLRRADPTRYQPEHETQYPRGPFGRATKRNIRWRP